MYFFILSSQSSSRQRVMEGSRLVGHGEMGPSDSHAQRVSHTGLQSEYWIEIRQCKIYVIYPTCGKVAEEK